jgi:hypothetical protein
MNKVISAPYYFKPYYLILRLEKSWEDYSINMEESWARENGDFHEDGILPPSSWELAR